MRVVGIHLFNDFSGSPLVFSEIMKGLTEKGLDCTIITNKSTGFLSDLKSIGYNKINYQWSKYKLLTLFYFFIAQWQIFIKVLKNKKAELVYINTILPFGAAIAAKLSGKKVIYHIHETSVKPALLKWFLFKVIEYTADQTIYVSDFLAQKEKLKIKNVAVVHNALPKSFQEKARQYNGEKEEFRVLMLCSLKAYKGINEFLSLAKYLPLIEFDLVLNAEASEIEKWLEDKKCPFNFHWYPVQSDVHPFYEKASLVLNLSHPNGWIETFGMTALEAMAYGLPVIVPPVGGIAELVEDNKNGFHLDCRQIFDVAEKIELLNQEEILYQKIAVEAKQRASEFSVEKMINEIYETLPSFQKSKKNLKIERKLSSAEL